MISAFPEFIDVTTTNKEEIESFTQKFEPYSDFNFVSLFAWDTEGKRKVALFNNGLAVLMTDYSTNEPLLSYLGIFDTDDIAIDLLNHTKKLGIAETLYFIGAESVKNLSNERILVEEDPSNFDYILSVQKLAELKGREHASKRHLANKFEYEYTNVVFESVSLNKSLFETHALPILELAKEKRGSLPNELQHEFEAIQRLFDKLECENLLLSTAFIDRKLAAFSIDEMLPNKYAISHFFKADYSYKGVTEYMNRRIAKYLLSVGIEYWNWEQDLGIESLKRMKSSYRPARLLKKYKISLK